MFTFALGVLFVAAFVGLSLGILWVLDRLTARIDRLHVESAKQRETLGDVNDRLGEIDASLSTPKPHKAVYLPLDAVVEATKRLQEPAREKQLCASPEQYEDAGFTHPRPSISDILREVYDGKDERN